MDAQEGCDDEMAARRHGVMVIYDLGCCLLNIDMGMHVVATRELSAMWRGFDLLRFLLKKTLQKGACVAADAGYVTVTTEFRTGIEKEIISGTRA